VGVKVFLILSSTLLWPALAADLPPHGAFCAPNERYPTRMIPITQNAPSGVYVAVGSERGLIGASLTPNATTLLLIDSDPGIVLQNRINTALLKLAQNRTDYLALRQATDFKVWARRIPLDHLLSPLERRLIGRPDVWRWWQEMFTLGENAEHWRAFLSPPGTLRAESFRGANYLFEDQHFQRLSSLAKGNRITVQSLDLNDPQAPARLTQWLKILGEPLSVLDLSNAWQSTYIKPENFASLLRGVDGAALPHSVLLTSNVVDFHGFTFRKIRSYPSAEQFRTSLDPFRDRTLPRHPPNILNDAPKSGEGCTPIELIRRLFSREP
jgi:hypothetical protein